MDDSLADILDGALDDFEDLTTSATSRKRDDASARSPAQPTAVAVPSPSVTTPTALTSLATDATTATSAEITPASNQDLPASAPPKTPAFDPLNKQRKPRKASDTKQISTPALPSAEASTSGHKLPPELEQLAADLAKLISETQPVDDSAAGPSTSGPAPMATCSSHPGPPTMASTTASLAALAEVRQQAVQAQGALPSPSGGGGMFGGLLPDMENLKDPHMNVIVDSIMQHLLSKEVLYQPMKDIRDCYPPWLQKNEGSIPAEDLERYKKQFGFIQEICRLYETDPSNYTSLVTLMQQMQACGDPPEDIVREMSSGLDHVPPTEGDAGDEPPIDLQQLQQEINKCPMQ